MDGRGRRCGPIAAGPPRSSRRRPPSVRAATSHGGGRPLAGRRAGGLDAVDGSSAGQARPPRASKGDTFRWPSQSWRVLPSGHVSESRRRNDPSPPAGLMQMNGRPAGRRFKASRKLELVLSSELYRPTSVRLGAKSGRRPATAAHDQTDRHTRLEARQLNSSPTELGNVGRPAACRAD
jgi:hypothetical protein